MKKNLLFLILILCTAVCMHALSEPAGSVMIHEVKFSINAPECGQSIGPDHPDESVPDFTIEEENGVLRGEPCAWITAYDTEVCTPFTGEIKGDQTYTACLTFRTAPGYAFSEDVRTLLLDTDHEPVEIEPSLKTADRLVVVFPVTAEHPWDDVLTEIRPATCIEEGFELRVCSADPAHVQNIVLPVNPGAHEWGRWSTVTKATKTREGMRSRMCLLCCETETESTGRLKLPYTEVYEPDTSWSMAATVAWRADADALTIAQNEVRPATAFVWLDDSLNVYDRDGGLLTDDLQSYIDQTSAGVIPAFCIRDARTASALKAFLPLSGLQDCFVVSTPENRELVKDVADLLHVRGMLDYTATLQPTREELLEMIASTNAAHGKVILLSAQAATRENVRFLQKLASTVWVQAPSDLHTLLTMCTRGVNGIVADDYLAATHALEWFRDDVPSLLRVPFIIGHRGDPSSYVENTLDSARGAFEEGADAVENDIQLSADGELFILHDDTPERLLGITDVDTAEELTLDELRSHAFLWNDLVAGIVRHNEVPASQSRTGTLYGQAEQKEYTVPVLREYIEAFQGTGLVHDTEIKSRNPAILPVYKAMIDAYDAWDQFFTITFNIRILDAMYALYPELSVGALCHAGQSSEADSQAFVGEIEPISDLYGPEAGLEQLMSVLDQWNATYNPAYYAYGEEAVRAGRHRGLTVWPWTYGRNTRVYFAKAYLDGVTALTTNDPWVASDYVIAIESGDCTAASADALPRPAGICQNGAVRTLDGAEAVQVEALSASQSLMIWRYRTTLDWDGETLGQYCLYSEPFVVTWE